MPPEQVALPPIVHSYRAMQQALTADQLTAVTTFLSDYIAHILDGTKPADLTALLSNETVGDVKPNILEVA